VKAAKTINQLLNRRARSSGVTVLSSDELALVVGGGRQTNWIAIEHRDPERIRRASDETQAGRELMGGLGNFEPGAAEEAYMRLQTPPERQERLNEALEAVGLGADPREDSNRPERDVPRSEFY
jgi:hypothetical protein